MYLDARPGVGDVCGIRKCENASICEKVARCEEISTQK